MLITSIGAGNDHAGGQGPCDRGYFMLVNILYLNGVRAADSGRQELALHNEHAVSSAAMTDSVWAPLEVFLWPVLCGLKLGF